MNAEIKEILEKMFLNCDTQEEKNKVLDYITNLQHTKEYLGEVLHEQDLKLEDYKSRVEKAVEITQNLLNTENSGYYKIIFQKQLDTLNGRSDE